MRTRDVTSARRSPELEQVSSAFAALHRDGGSPRGALDLLYAIVHEGTWKRVETERGTCHGTFTAFIEAGQPFGLGTNPNELRKLLKLQHPGEGVAEIAERMAWLRGEVERLLGGDIPAAPAHGEVGKGRLRESATLSKRRDATAITARLKRDDPKLAERVVTGEVSPNAAARQMGWRRPRIVVSSPERVAEALRRVMPPEDLARLVVILGGSS